MWLNLIRGLSDHDIFHEIFHEIEKFQKNNFQILSGPSGHHQTHFKKLIK